MNYRMLIIREEIESEYQSEMKLWPNTDGDIWIQISIDETDPYSTQGMAITTDDARALIAELTALVKDIGAHQPRINQASTKGKTLSSNQQSTNDQPAKARQLTLTQPSHDPGNEQVPIPSKVNWNK